MAWSIPESETGTQSVRFASVQSSGRKMAMPDLGGFAVRIAETCRRPIIRQTGKRGESTMRHMSIRLRPDFGR